MNRKQNKIRQRNVNARC